ncbi:MAG: hypothetical protein WA667_20815 [Candidatus Nitrosopolaris sp.]
MTEFRTFGCTNCGSPYPAVQPDDIHVVVSLKPCPKGDSIEMPVDCNKCNHRNVLHWDKKHQAGEERFNRIAGVSP